MFGSNPFGVATAIEMSDFAQPLISELQTLFPSPIHAILIPLSFFFFSFIKFITRFIERWTTEQALTNKRVFRKVGLIRRDTDELVYEKIETVAVKQSILGRIFNFGEVEFTGTGGMYIRFVFVKDPTEVKRNFKH